MSTQSLADAVARQEGWYSSTLTRGQKNNNPGNLLYTGQAGAVGKDDKGFAIFSSAQYGWDALYRQIGFDANRGDTIEKFVCEYLGGTWAGGKCSKAEAGNDVETYIRNIVAWTGFSASTPLSSAMSGSPVAIAAAVTPTAPAPAPATDWGDWLTGSAWEQAGLFDYAGQQQPGGSWLSSGTAQTALVAGAAVLLLVLALPRKSPSL